MVSGFRFSVYLQECLLGDATIRIGYLVEEVSVRLTVLDIWTVHNTVFCWFIRLIVDYYCEYYIYWTINKTQRSHLKRRLLGGIPALAMVSKIKYKDGGGLVKTQVNMMKGSAWHGSGIILHQDLLAYRRVHCHEVFYLVFSWNWFSAYPITD